VRLARSPPGIKLLQQGGIVSGLLEMLTCEAWGEARVDMQRTAADLISALVANESGVAALAGIGGLTRTLVSMLREVSLTLALTLTLS